MLTSFSESHCGRVDQTGDERLAGSVRADAKYRDRNLLATGPRIRHIDTPLGIDDRVVHLVEACRDHRTDFDGWLIAVDAVNVQSVRAAGQPRRDQQIQA